MSKKGVSDKSPGKRESQTKSPMTEKSKSFSLFKIIFFTSSAIIGLTSYYVYNMLMTFPEVPKVDMNQWWGTYPIDQKPDESIRPFRIEFDDVTVNDLRERLLHQRPFVPPLEGTGFTYGFNTNFLGQVLHYWKNSYNFKDREAFLNKYEHFKTKIQGLDIHFMRVKPKVEKGVTVVPLLMLHTWPGSIREFYELVPLLTTPRPGHDFVFEIIAPSLPEFGFSQGASRPGLGGLETAVIMHNLMKRIGLDNYYVQGGDYGHMVGSALATLFPDSVKGFHTNTPVLFHRMAGISMLIGSIWPSLVVEPELADRMFPVIDKIKFWLEESGYYHLQSTKPDTIGIALTDSPAGLAAYILEKFSTWTNKDFRKASDGNLLSKFTLTHLLDNVMIYWTTNSITTSMRLYKEVMSPRHLGLMLDEIPTPVPTAGIKFKHDLMFNPDFVLRMKFTNYLQSTAVEEGGHFAALEMPNVMADDIFQAVDKFLEFHGRDSKPNEQAPTPPNWETAKTIYDFTVKDINGQEVKLDRYKGHVAIIVNVASQCGFTNNHYKQLNELYDKYSQTRGLRILAFPCNQFGAQEPGSPQEIFEFTKDRGVKFDLFEKVEVNGENAHPLWKFLKKSQSGTMGDFIKWNFSKFIIDKNGVPVERMAPTVNPIDMEPSLAKYWKPNEQAPTPPNWETAKTIYDFTVKDINGQEVKLDRYKGHVAIIVNVASQCGFTNNHYKQLNELYDKYSQTRGLRILAFPCNQFGAQEPGSPQEIFEFTKDRGVKFDLFEKVEVNGENAHPLWKFLKKSQSGTMGDFIKWNFSKFIIDKNGVPVERMAPTVNPIDMEPSLAKYW